MTENTTMPRPRRGAPTEARACRACGVVVKHPDPARAEVLHIWRSIGVARTDLPQLVTEIPVTRCDICADRRELAAELLHDHPRVARELGDFGLDQLDAVLGALDLRGLRPRKVAESMAKTDRELAELLSELLSIGAAISWSEHYVTQSTGEAKRWGHVSPELARAAGETYRQLFHYRVETPMPYTPPSDDGALHGCLFCGRGTLIMRQRDALAAWGDLQHVYTGELGGQIRPEPVSGYFCPDCREAVENLGAPGVPAVERALIWFAGGVKRSSGYRLNMPTTARAWATLPTGTAPNAEPWAHVNVAKLRTDLADLESRGAVRRPLPGEPR